MLFEIILQCYLKVNISIINCICMNIKLIISN